MNKLKLNEVPNIVHQLEPFHSKQGLTKEHFVFLGIVKRIEKLEGINFKDMGKRSLSGYDLLKYDCFQDNYFEWKADFEESYKHLVNSQGISIRNLIKQSR